MKVEDIAKSSPHEPNGLRGFLFNSLFSRAFFIRHPEFHVAAEHKAGLGIKRGQGAKENQNKREHEPFQEMHDDVFPGELYFSFGEEFDADDNRRYQSDSCHLENDPRNARRIVVDDRASVFFLREENRQPAGNAQ